MEKVVRALVVTLLVLGAASMANAAWTTNVYSTTVTSDVTLGQSYTWGAGGVGYLHTVSWDHLWTAPAIGGNITAVDLQAADLTVNASNANDKTATIHLGSAAAPSLGDLQSGSNLFVGLPLDSTVLDGNTSVFAKLFKSPEWGTITLNSSKLNVTYQITEQVWEDDPIPPAPVVPAPAALLLSGLGAGLVGWLRRRGTV